MATENKKDEQNCGKKRKAMLAYGIIQLGSRVISAAALAAIALNFCSLKKESQLFAQCVNEVQSSGESGSRGVGYCNGGK